MSLSYVQADANDKEKLLFATALGQVMVWHRHRADRRWSQSKLAMAVGFTQPTISKIEVGAMIPEAFLFGKIAEAFDLSVGQFQNEIDKVVSAAKEAAKAISPDKSWYEVLAGVGALGILGLVKFVVAALFGSAK